MNEKFEWHCYKDEKPVSGKWLCVGFFRPDGTWYSSIGKLSDFGWDEDCYWYYVDMKEPPKIEKKLTLEERVEQLEFMMKTMKVQFTPYDPNGDYKVKITTKVN